MFLLIHSSKSALRYRTTFPNLTNGKPYLFVIRQTASVLIFTPIYTAASRGVIRPDGAILQTSLTGVVSLIFFLPNEKEKSDKKKTHFPLCSDLKVGNASGKFRPLLKSISIKAKSSLEINRVEI